MSDSQRNWGQNPWFVLKVVIQVLVVGLVGLLFWYLGNNISNNLNNKNLPTGFGFLTEPTNFAITDNQGFDSTLPFWRAILIGIQNTVLAGLIGIAIATVLGTIVGIARLSTNWLVAKTASIFVETFRNIPPLCIIIFFSAALFVSGPLPIFSKSYIVKLPFINENFLLFSNRRIAFPGLASDGNVALFWWLILGGAILAIAIFIYRTFKHIATGASHHRWLWSLGFLIVFSMVAFIIADTPYRFSWPSISQDGRLLIGGFAASAGYLSLTLALATYTASHIAEIVRGSIQSIPKGQSEAAYALNAFQKYRFIILPQAFRVSIPPTISQYLNLMKNTSLGIAVAYPDIAALLLVIGVGNKNPAPQSILMMMAIYLALSLIISLVGNSYNKLFLSNELKKVATQRA